MPYWCRLCVTLLKWLCLHLFLDSITNFFHFQELVALTSSPCRIGSPHPKSSKSLSADIQRNKFLFFLCGYSNICYGNVSYSWMVRTPASHPEHPGLYSCFRYWFSGQGFNGQTVQVYGSVPLRLWLLLLLNKFIICKRFPFSAAELLSLRKFN